MEYVHAISLPAKAGMLEIIRKIYENIDSTETINPIDINKKPCAGVGSRAYLYSLIFTPNAWMAGIHDAEITIFDKNDEAKKTLVNFRIRFETNIKEIYIYSYWEMWEWLPIIKDSLDSFFLDYRINLSIRPEIKTT